MKASQKAIVEICCGSYYDCLQAEAGGAQRVELNAALHMDGLTPSLGSVELAKQNTRLSVIAMLRPRGAGFCYNDADYAQMLADLRLLLDSGADGLAYACLLPDGSIDQRRTGELTDMVKRSGGEAVFHRAFDCCLNPDDAMRTLIDLGVDRVLTSGLADKAPQGLDTIKRLQAEYGDRIQILAGGGVNEKNAAHILEYTGVSQIHSSCKGWLRDDTTIGPDVSFGYASDGHEGDYDAVDAEKVRRLVQACGN